MTRTIPNLAGGIAALTFLLAIGIACDNFVRVKGKVLDESGNPVAGASVTVTISGEGLPEHLTKSDGAFDIISHAAPVLSSAVQLQVKKDGFETYKGKFNSNDLPLNPNVRPELEAEKIIVLRRSVPGA